MNNSINIIKQNEILQNPSYAEWKASGKLYSKRNLWLDKFGDLDKTLGDNVQLMRSMNIHKQESDYTDLAMDTFARFFKLTGATAVVPTNNGNAKLSMPDINFNKNKLLSSMEKLNVDTSVLGKNAQLATYNNDLLSYNNMIIGMYDQITPTNVSSIMEDFPEAMYPAIGLYIASWSAIRGMTHQHQSGNGFFETKKRDVDYQFFQTQKFAEKNVWHEEEVIGLRQPDSNTFMEKGLPIYMAKNMAMLEHRRQTRIVFDTYRTIYDGVIYNNNAPISSNISPLNRFTGSQIGGAPWATFDPVSGAVTSVNSSVNVLVSLRNLVHALLKKYTGYVLKMKMCSLTLAAILDNPSITAINQVGPGFMAGNGILPGDEKQLETILKQFLATNVQLEVVIDDAMYTADIQDPLGRTPGETYFLNDVGKIAILPQVQATGAAMGGYNYTPVVQNGGMYNPQPGAAFFMIDTFASNTTQGMENPSLSQAVVWSALPCVYRPQDLYTLDISQ